MPTLARYCLFALLTVAALAAKTTVSDARYAHLARGVNLTRWFQYGSSIPITAADRDLLQGAGFTSVRIAVAPQYLLPKWASPQRIERNLARLDAAVALFVNSGMAVMLDFHADTPYVDYLLAAPGAAAELADTWRMLAARYRNRDPELLFFEIMNEPDRRFTQAAWDQVQRAALAAIRESAPEHTVLLAPAAWSGLDGLAAMTPYDDPNVIYVLHYYSPIAFTHQGTTWSSPELAGLRNISWPAYLAADEAGDPAARALLERYREDDWDAASLDWDMGLAAAWAAHWDARVIVNEFGGYKPFAPPDARARWLRDVRKAIARRGFGWTFWDYGAGFDLTVKEGGARTIDPAMSAALGLAPWTLPEPVRETPFPALSALRTIEPIFSPPGDGERPAFTSAVAAADINGDGLADLLVAQSTRPELSSQPVRIYLNKGGGLAEEAGFDGPAPTTRFVASFVQGKFDRSGRMGWFLPDRASGTSHLLLPSGAALLKAVPLEGLPVLSAVAGDLRRRGVDDLVVFHEGGAPEVLRNSGNGQFHADPGALPAWLGAANREDNHFQCGVLVRRGRAMDLLVFGAAGSAPRLLRGDAKGRFRDGGLLPPAPTNAGPAPGGCAVARDLNGDGLTDVIVGWRQDALQILINAGDGRFRDETVPLSLPLPPSRNGLDRVAVTQGTLVITRIGDTPLVRSFNSDGNSDGRLVDHGGSPRSGPWLAVPVDWNGDGSVDLVFGQGSGSPVAARFGR